MSEKWRRFSRPTAAVHSTFIFILMLASMAAGGLADDPSLSELGRNPYFPALVIELKATPGCLGVETARTDGGKDVILAWFEDKKAALRWFHSDAHRQVMKSFFPNHTPGAREPLKDVPDDGVPILTIATMTMSDKPQLPGASQPISQISIELYSPLGEGLALGGRLAPEAMKTRGAPDSNK
jgi:hypothetical protein